MSDLYKETTHKAYMIVAALVELNLSNGVLDRLLKNDYEKDAEEVRKAIIRLQKSLIRRAG